MLVSYTLFRFKEGIGWLLQAISYFNLRKAVYNFTIFGVFVCLCIVCPGRFCVAKFIFFFGFTVFSNLWFRN